MVFDSSIVAIVDDNAAILQSMEFLLELEGYEVIVYASPASFLDDRTTQPACLIIDQNMPGMTGLQLITRLRQQENHIPILLMCGFLSTDIIARASELGVTRVLEKPLEPDNLLEFVAGFVAPCREGTARTMAVGEI
jgi:two-component system response regulator FixJ